MRTSEIARKTLETEIMVKLNLDGTGKTDIDTGVGFLDHMLTLLGKHGFLDLTVKAQGDLNVDSHHTVEDVGLALGQALQEALGNKAGIHRYGSCLLPMDETLAQIALDFESKPITETTLIYRQALIDLQQTRHDLLNAHQPYTFVAVMKRLNSLDQIHILKI